MAKKLDRPQIHPPRYPRRSLHPPRGRALCCPTRRPVQGKHKIGAPGTTGDKTEKGIGMRPSTCKARRTTRGSLGQTGPTSNSSPPQLSPLPHPDRSKHWTNSLPPGKQRGCPQGRMREGISSQCPVATAEAAESIVEPIKRPRSQRQRHGHAKALACNLGRAQKGRWL